METILITSTPPYIRKSLTFSVRLCYTSLYIACGLQYSQQKFVMDRVVEVRGSSTGKFSTGSRRYYDANFKIMVINHAKISNNCAAARKYGISEANVRRWINDEARLKNARSTRKAFSGPQQGRFKEIENEVVDYVREKRKEGMAITRDVIRMKAREVAQQKAIPGKFKGSNGWCTRMMQRNGLVLRRRTTLAQHLPDAYEEKLTEFQRYVIKLRKQHSYLMGQIGNADETPVYFDMPSNTTVDDKGAKSVLVRTTGNDKSRITVMLCVLADGRKMPPYVILNRKTMPKEQLPPGIIFRCQEKGWMTNELMVDWVRTVWNRKPGALLKLRGMLVLDAFKGHLTPQVKKEINNSNTDLVVIPGGMTSQLQVLDVMVNKPFKDHLKQLYTNWLLGGGHALTPTGKLKKPSIALLGEWILKAWAWISSDSIVVGFKKCCITNALDGSEDDILWRDVQEISDTDASNDSSSESD